MTYHEAFGLCFLVVAVLGLFLLAIREEAKDCLREADPTEDTTKVRRLG